MWWRARQRELEERLLIQIQERDRLEKEVEEKNAQIDKILDLNENSIETVQVLLEGIDKVRATCQGLLGDDYSDVSIEQLMDMVQIHVLTMEEKLRER